MSVSVLSRIFRRKVFGSQNDHTTLERCLGLLDLTALGVGSTLGSGIYVVAGQVARSTAGPSVVLSFIIAAIASVLAGLCYAEFGARVPRAGSAYIYSYVTVGELWAFIIGWNLILEYVIGTASVARATGAYVDTIFKGVLGDFFRMYMPINVTFLSEYPDLLALGATLLLTVILCIGVKESSVMNNVFTIINLFVMLYVLICGCWWLNFDNWHLPEHKEANSTDNGGFFPFGIGGMLSGSATCFYAFVGFDVIATTGEEVINPERVIPLSIILCLLICSIAYIGISSVLTLMVPYFMLDLRTPLSSAFDHVGWYVAKDIVAGGALLSLITCLLTSMFPMPRIIYSMARDGLLFRFLSKLNHRFKTPIVATVISGVLAGTLAMLLDLSELVDMMSIGTLLAYTLVAACVLILRYEPTEPMAFSVQDVETSHSCPFGLARNSLPSRKSSLLVKVAVASTGILTIWLGAVEIYLSDYIIKHVWWALLLLLLPISLLLVAAVIIWCQPQNSTPMHFKVPFVPILPIFSIVMNVYLMLKLSKPTWIRFGVWMAIGFLIYFGYGIWHSDDKPEVDEVNEDDQNSSEITADGNTFLNSEQTPLLSRTITEPITLSDRE